MCRRVLQCKAHDDPGCVWEPREDLKNGLVEQESEIV
jgi:hypothetical protein